MNYSDKFGASSFQEVSSPFAKGDLDFSTPGNTAAQQTPSGFIKINDAELLFSGNYKREGSDLVISNDVRKIVVPDYFKGEVRPTLTSRDGATLSGKIVDALTGHVTYAQAGQQPEPPKEIGTVGKLTGTATAIRNGVAVELKIGDKVYKGDVLQSGSDSSLGVTFIDGTVFSLSSNARMVLNEMVYDPNSTSNSSLLSLVQGTITFVAGQTAKNGNMRVDTPVATMGIRGTAVLVEIGADNGPTKFSVLVEPGNKVGTFNLYDKSTGSLIGTVSQAGQVTLVTPGGVGQQANAVEIPKTVQDLQSERSIIKQAFELFFPNFNDANPQGTKGVGSSVNNLANLLDQASRVNPGTILLDAKFNLPGSSGPVSVTVSGSSTPPPIVITNVFDIQPPEEKGGQFDIGGQVKPDSRIISYIAGSGRLDTAEGPSSMPSGFPLRSLVTLDPQTGRVTYNPADFRFLADGEQAIYTFSFQTQADEFIFTRTVTLTVDGLNDDPIFTATNFDAPVVEPGSTDAITSFSKQSTLTFTDLDFSDVASGYKVETLGVTATGRTIAVPNTAALLGFLHLNGVTKAVGTTQGVITETFTAPANAFDYLAAGESVNLIYQIRVSDADGASRTTTLTVTVTGTNDAPTITGATTPASTSGDLSEDGVLTASGVITFRDVDLSNTHTAVAPLTGGTISAPLPGFTPATSSLGSLSVHVNENTTDANNIGTVNWTYSLDNLIAQRLAEGQVVTQTFTVTITDSSGATVTQPVTVTITGTNDVPEVVLTQATLGDASVVQTNVLGAITEPLAADAGALSADGIVVFKDVDLIDSHTAAFVVKSSNATADLPGFNEGLGTTDAEGAVSYIGTFALGNINESTVDLIDLGAVGWTFTIDRNDPTLQSLAQGQTITQVYTITITDSSPSHATVSKDVTVTITGTNDAPVIDAIVDQSYDEPVSGALTATIGVTFTDVDLIDVGHTATVTGVDVGGVKGGLALDDLGLIALLTPDVVTKTGTSANGSFDLHFSAPAGTFDYLADGEELILTYTVTVDDGDLGGASTQTVKITITGTNDAPVVATTDVTGAVEEAGTPAGNLTDTGTIGFTDVDLSDMHSIDPVIVRSVGALGSLTASVTTDTAGSGTGGVITWTYAVPASAVEYLAENQTKVETFTITLDDGNGGTVQRTISVTITGTNDAPVIDAIVDQSLNEQTGNAPLTATIGVTFTDVDLIDIGHAATVTGVEITSGVTAGLDAGLDLLALLTADPVIKTGTSANGSFDLHFSAPAGSFDYLAAGEELTLTYTITVDDGDTDGVSTQTVNIVITGTNDAPVIGATTQANLTEAQAGQPNATSLPQITFTDLDLTDVGHTASVTNVAATGAVTGLALNDTQLKSLIGIEFVTKAAGSTSGAVTLGFSAFSYPTAFDYLAANEILTLTYTLTVSDGDGGLASKDFVVTITGANDAPVLTVGPYTDLTTITEDDVNNVGQTVASFIGASITDADHNAVEGIAITGSPASNHGHWEFSIDGGQSWSQFGSYSASSALLLNSDDFVRFVPNGENGGIDTFTFVAWDRTTGAHGTPADTTTAGGTSAFSTQSGIARVEVTSVNDAPVITSNGGGAATSISFAENSTDAVTTVTATDVDQGATITYSIVTGAGSPDSAFFTMTPQGVLSFINPPDYESQTHGSVYTVQVKASDGSADDIQTITVNVTNVVEGFAAANDTVSATEDTATPGLRSALIANDSNPGNLTLTITAVGNAQGGTIALNGGNPIFTPFANFSGAATFDYTVSNGVDDPSSATVTVNVAPVADVPHLNVGAPQPITNDFRVNLTTANAQEYSAVAALSTGGSVIAWVSSGQDGSGTGIYAQRLDASGNTVGTEFRVNTATADNQSSPFISGFADGGFVVTWVSGSNNTASVHAQRFDATGATAGSEITVATGENPAAAVLSDGRFVITYCATDGSANGQWVQIYNPNGTAAGGPVLANTFTSNYQQSGNISATADGGFIVAWHSYSQDATNSWGVYFQRFDANGAKAGGEVRANAITTGDQVSAHVAVLKDGTFVVTWTDQTAGTVNVRTFTAAGVATGSEVTIAGGQDNTVQALADGGFIVTYKAFDVGTSLGLFGQRFDAAGNKIGEALTINQAASGDQNFLSDRSFPTAVLTSGDIISTWFGEPNVDGTEIYARMFSVPGTGSEDTPFSLGEILAGLTDTDGSETIVLKLSGFPSGTTFSVGHAGSGADAGKWIIEGGPGNGLIWTPPLTLTPPTNFNGSFTLHFDAVATETANGASATTSRDLVVSVNAVNDAPVINAAALTISEGATVVLTPANIGITDPDSATFTYTVSSVTHGVFETTSNGTTWVAATSFTTADIAAGHVRFVHDGSEAAPTFSIQANDGAATNNLSGVTAASINFTNTNDAPVAFDSAESIDEDSVLSGGVPQGFDPENGAVTYVLDQTVSAGQLTAFEPDDPNGPGRFSFDARGAFDHLALGQTEDVSFTYHVVDDQGVLSASKTVTITVEGVNDAPSLDLNPAAAGVGYSVNLVNDGQVSTPIAVAPVVADIDSATLVSATVVLTDGKNGDYFLVPDLASGINWAITGTAGDALHPLTITFTGNFSASAYADAIEQVSFGTAAGGAIGDRHIDVTVNDGHDNSNTATATVHVEEPANVTPAITLDHALQGAAAGYDGGRSAPSAVLLPNLGISGDSAVTVEFWLKDGLTTDQSSMLFGFQQFDLLALGFPDLRGHVLGFNTGSGDLYGIQLPLDFADKPHHIAAVFSTNFYQSKLYIDGQLQQLTNLGDNGSNPGQAYFTDTPYIGGWGVNPNYSFQGQIDDLRVWHGERSDEDINGSMHVLRGSLDDLVANYQFEQVANGAGGVIDSSGNGHHGTLSTFTAEGNVVETDGFVTSEDVEILFTDDNAIKVTYPENDILTLDVSVINGRLTYSNSIGLVDYDGETGLWLQVQGTVSVINAFLNGMIYQGLENFNGPDALLISISDEAGSPVLERQIPIDVRPANDAPVLDLNGDYPDGQDYFGTVQNAGFDLSQIASVPEIIDIDGDTQIFSATIKIENAEDGDFLFIAEFPPGISWQVDDSDPGVIIATISGAASLNDYEGFVGQVRFGTNSEITGTRGISVTVNDGHTDSDAVYAYIDVTQAPPDDNNPPVAADDFIFARSDFSGMKSTLFNSPNEEFDPDGDQFYISSVEYGGETFVDSTDGVTDGIIKVQGAYGTLWFYQDAGAAPFDSFANAGDYFFLINQDINGDPIANNPIFDIQPGDHLDDVFYYTLSDGQDESDPAQVTVRFDPAVVDVEVGQGGYDSTDLLNDLKFGTLQPGAGDTQFVLTNEGRVITINGKNLAIQDTGNGGYLMQGGLIKGFQVYQDGQLLFRATDYSIIANGTVDELIKSSSTYFPNLLKTYQYDIHGSNGADVLIGGDLDDRIDIESGVTGYASGMGDQVFANGGNDLIIVHDDNQWFVDGGTGIDTLRASGSFITGLSEPGSNLQNIEIIDLGTAQSENNGAVSILIDGEGAHGVNDYFGDGYGVLRILGDGQDTVRFKTSGDAFWSLDIDGIGIPFDGGPEDFATYDVLFDRYFYRDMNDDVLAEVYVQHGVEVAMEPFGPVLDVSEAFATVQPADVYFFDTNEGNGNARELWKLDANGNPALVAPLVHEGNPVGFGGPGGQATQVFDGSIYFIGSESGVSQIYKLDTDGALTKLTDFNTANGGISGSFFDLDGSLYFRTPNYNPTYFNGGLFRIDSNDGVTRLSDDNAPNGVVDFLSPVEISSGQIHFGGLHVNHDGVVDGQTFSIDVTVGHGTLVSNSSNPSLQVFEDGSSGVFGASGSFAKIQEALQSGFTYTPTEGAPDIITIEVSDDLTGTHKDTTNFIFVQANQFSATLTGTTEKDIFIGSINADQFVFAPGNGHDIITNYQAGLDHIDLQAFANVSSASIASWLASAATQQGNDTLLNLDPLHPGQHTILLQNVQKSAITVNDFVLHPGI